MTEMATKQWVVYILRCSDETLYTGITNDLEARVAKHNEGTGAKYTRSRRPVVPVWFKAVESKSEAAKLEIQIKKLSRSEKLELIK